MNDYFLPAQAGFAQLVDAVRLGGTSVGEAQAELESRLSPMVRLALRRQAGIPEVVGWVHQALARFAGDGKQRQRRRQRMLG